LLAPVYRTSALAKPLSRPTKHPKQNAAAQRMHQKKQCEGSPQAGVRPLQICPSRPLLAPVYRTSALAKPLSRPTKHPKENAAAQRMHQNKHARKTREQAFGPFICPSRPFFVIARQYHPPAKLAPADPRSTPKQMQPRSRCPQENCDPLPRTAIKQLKLPTKKLA
jgi:hypothetical protein